MPIRFQQPGPFSGDAALGGGEAQQFSRDLPSVAGAHRGLAEMYIQAARLAQERAHYQQQQAPHIGGGGGHGFIPPGPSFAPQGGGGGGQGQVVQLAPDPLTRQEEMRLERLRNALSVIRDDPNLSDEEKQNGALQLQTGIDPLKQRQEQARLSLQQEQVQQAQHQNALLVSMRRQDDQYDVSGAHELLTPAYDSVTGEYLGMYQRDRRTGLLMPLESSRAESRGERGGETVQLLNTVRHQIETQVARELHDYSAITFQGTRPSWLSDPAAEVERRYQARRRALGLEQQGGQQPQGYQGGWPFEAIRAGVQQQGGQQSAPAETQPPFDPANQDGMTVSQRRSVEALRALREQALNAPVSSEQASTFLQAVERVQGLLARYGSRLGMPPRERNEFDRLSQHLRTIPARPAAAPPQGGFRGSPADFARQAY